MAEFVQTIPGNGMVNDSLIVEYVLVNNYLTERRRVNILSRPAFYRSFLILFFNFKVFSQITKLDVFVFI